MDLPALYVAATEASLSTLSLSHELGHLGAGLLLYFAALGFTGVHRAAVLPLGIVILAEGMNEIIQAAHYGSWRMADTLADIGWTVTLPVLIYAWSSVLRPRAILATLVGASGGDDRAAVFPV